ncbi:MAG: hypothetical protein KDB10_00735, partial [Acidimicrobiales bacterium]|nr:hypothetical protein [Acidimicrobiales bacterium]
TAVVLDTCADHHPAATFEAAVEVAASLVAASGRHHFPVVLHDTSGARTAAGRDGVVTGLLDALAGVDATAPGGVADVVGRLRDEEVGTSLVLVTGRLTDRDAAALAAVRRQY